MTAVTVYVGLGSNLKDPLCQLATAVSALAALRGTTLTAQSPFYASRPVGPQDQPDFVNGVACLQTQLAPLALLDALQAIENDQQRVRQRHWGPRTLDLDLLLYGDDTIASDRLTVPHKELVNRDFVLQPLLDINPDLALPDGRSLRTLRQSCPDNSLRRLTPVERSLASMRPAD